VVELSLIYRVRSSAIWREQNRAAAPPHIKESAKVVHLVRMPPGHLALAVLRAGPTGRRPQGRLRTHCRDYISHLPWEHHKWKTMDGWVNGSWMDHPHHWQLLSSTTG